MPTNTGTGRTQALVIRLCFDGGGARFINYLVAGIGEMPETAERKLIASHRSSLLSAALDARSRPAAHDKIQWAIRYHNYVVVTRYGGSEELLIAPSDPIVEFIQLSDT